MAEQDRTKLASHTWAVGNSNILSPSPAGPYPPLCLPAGLPAAFPFLPASPWGRTDNALHSGSLCGPPRPWILELSLSDLPSGACACVSGTVPLVAGKKGQQKITISGTPNAHQSASGQKMLRGKCVTLNIFIKKKTRNLDKN